MWLSIPIHICHVVADVGQLSVSTGKHDEIVVISLESPCLAA